MDKYSKIVAYPERLTSGDYATAIKLVRAFATHSSPSVSGKVDTPEFRALLRQVGLTHEAVTYGEDHAIYEEAIDAVLQHTAQAVRAAREESAIVGWNDALAEARAELSERQNHLETFGPYSEEAARIALDGAIDTLDELKRTPQAAGTEQGEKSGN
jgi:hypothetical protein